ncbi:MAG: hypothetical protein AAGA69_06820 [Pseudomonadota bacterium]
MTTENSDGNLWQYVGLIEMIGLFLIVMVFAVREIWLVRRDLKENNTDSQDSEQDTE